MKKNERSILIIIIIVWMVMTLIVVTVSRKNSGENNKISAKVVNVVDRPNQAEDGYYGITVQTDDGRQYLINATGYLNTPLSPHSKGETCLNIPKVQAGNSVEFNLPKAESQDNTYDICYEKKLSGYYFRLL